MTQLNLFCIVEGHAERQAAGVLVRRIGRELRPDLAVNVLPPLRVGRQRILKPGELERALLLGLSKAASPRAFLILLDADDDCPAQLGPQLVARAGRTCSHVPTGVVLAKREFEGWFLAAFESLGGKRGLQDPLPTLSGAEGIRDAKKVLTRHMQGRRTYSAVLDQPALTQVFDMALARQRSDSSDKCWREVSRLLASVSSAT